MGCMSSLSEFMRKYTGFLLLLFVVTWTFAAPFCEPNSVLCSFLQSTSIEIARARLGVGTNGATGIALIDGKGTNTFITRLKANGFTNIGGSTLVGNVSITGTLAVNDTASFANDVTVNQDLHADTFTVDGVSFFGDLMTILPPVDHDNPATKGYADAIATNATNFANQKIASDGGSGTSNQLTTPTLLGDTSVGPGVDFARLIFENSGTSRYYMLADDFSEGGSILKIGTASTPEGIVSHGLLVAGGLFIGTGVRFFDDQDGGSRIVTPNQFATTNLGAMILLSSNTITFTGSSAPELSGANEAKIYVNSVGVPKISTNGGAYQDMIGGVSTIGNFEYPTNAGEVSTFNMVVNSSSPAGDRHGYIFKFNGLAAGELVGQSDGAGSVTNVHWEVGGGEVGKSVSVYAGGTAATLTGSSALLDFGTTDPTVVLPQAGTWFIYASVNARYNAATYADNQTGIIKLRRTNNTAADIANASRTNQLEIVTAFTGPAGFLALPVIVYTTVNNDDSLSLYGILSALPGVGSMDVTEASIVAIRK